MDQNQSDLLRHSHLQIEPITIPSSKMNRAGCATQVNLASSTAGKWPIYTYIYIAFSLASSGHQLHANLYGLCDTVDYLRNII